MIQMKRWNMGTVISFVNEKGGVGKTHTATQVALMLAAMEQKVLFIDNDASGDATTTMTNGDIPEAISAVFTTAGVANTINLYNSGTVMTPVNVRPNIDFFGAGERLVTVSGEDAIFSFVDAVESLATNYDYVLIDCPPSIGTQSTAAIRSSDAIIVPCIADMYSYKNAITILTRLKIEQKRQKKAPKILGVFLNMLKNPPPNSVKEVIEIMREDFGPLFLQSEDGRPIALSATVKQTEAQAGGQSVLESAPNSNAAIEMAALVEELLNRLDNIDSLNHQYQEFSSGRPY